MRYLIIAVIAAAIFIPAAAQAKPQCACAESSLDMRTDRADAIFTGTVTSIKQIDSFVTPYNADIPVTVTLDITMPIKGTGDDKTFTLTTNLTRNTCTGYPFVEGQSYLVFAYQRQMGTHASWSPYTFSIGTYDVGGLCGGTKKIADAKDELAKLDAMSLDGKKHPPAKKEFNK